MSVYASCRKRSNARLNTMQQLRSQWFWDVRGGFVEGCYCETKVNEEEKQTKDTKKKKKKISWCDCRPPTLGQRQSRAVRRLRRWLSRCDVQSLRVQRDKADGVRDVDGRGNVCCVSVLLTCINI